uniref:Ras-related protein Rab-39B n=1 Tax=Caligus clemensi TaxID=344056 RepID=C1C0T8_CALCM|nr:Ras-related protein Rab-39B [Caligus clemensi]
MTIDPLEKSTIPIDPTFDYQFRLILIGDSTVGKSSLLRYFTDGSFGEVSDPTVGIDFFAKLLPVKDGRVMKLLLWDTAGQERFRSITRSYYRNTVAALLIYDICNRESFTHVPTWMAEAKKHMEPHKCVFILVGCKYDIAESGPGIREVPTEEARTFAELHGLQFLETSAKTGQNVDKVFRMLSQEIYDKLQSGKLALDADWDGIKKGYFPESNRLYRKSARGSGGTSRGASTRVGLNGTDGRYPIAEPVSQKCC